MTTKNQKTAEDQEVIKKQIERLKDMAEVACASYGYFHLIGEKLDKDSLKKLGKDEHIIQEIDILDIAYKGLTAEGHRFYKPKNLMREVNSIFSAIPFHKVLLHSVIL